MLPSSHRRLACVHCAWPHAADICQQSAGIAQQPQASIACVRSHPWMISLNSQLELPSSHRLCARPPAADINQPTTPTPFSQAQVAAEFPRVLTTSKKLPAVLHKFQHLIETTCRQPISSRYLWLDPEKLEAAKKEFAEMEAQGIESWSNSSWSSPLHMVGKADGM